MTFVLLIVFICVGCGNKQEEDNVKENTCFEDEFYDKVESIILNASYKVENNTIENETLIKEISELILSSENSISDKDLNDYDGGVGITFIYADDSSVIIQMTSALLMCNGVTYNIESDLYDQIIQCFK